MKANTPVFSAAVILLVLGSPVFAYQQVIDLGTLGGTSSRASSINDSGQIVGYATNSSGYKRACLFDSTGGSANTDLGTLGGSQSNAYSINNNGKIVGYAIDNYGSTYACLFNSTGGGNNKNLGTLDSVPTSPTYGGGNYGSAYCINDNGYIVGQARKDVQSGGSILSYLHACSFDQTIPWSNYDLGFFVGTTSLAYSINNNNQIVGYDSTSGFSRACLFGYPNGTHNIDLGTLGGHSSIAYSINDSDLIVGLVGYSTALPPSWYYHACLFDSSGGGDNIDLGTLGGLNSVAYFVNSANQIVGYATDSSGQQKACLFDSTGNGNNIDLNTLIDPSSGWILKEASCINNNGWIVGYGTYNGIDQAFLLTPEPTTLLLFGLGVSLLRRKK